MTLTRIDWEDAYYRCLSIRVAPSPRLLQAHHRARAVFAPAPERAFRPHLSLLYGELPETRKAALARRLEREYSERLGALRLALYTTGGPPGAWRCIGSFEMGG